jgi:glycine dehydrogenase subunit 2
MIEPTESEDKKTLDEFIETMIKIALDAEKNPQSFDEYPKNTPVKKIDEVYAARNLDLRQK